MSSLRCTRSPDAHHHLCTWLTQNTNLGGQPWQNNLKNCKNEEVGVSPSLPILPTVIQRDTSRAKSIFSYPLHNADHQTSLPIRTLPAVLLRKPLGEKWVQHANWRLANNMELHFWTKTTRIHQSVAIIQFQQKQAQIPTPALSTKKHCRSCVVIHGAKPGSISFHCKNKSPPKPARSENSMSWLWSTFGTLAFDICSTWIYLKNLWGSESSLAPLKVM